MKPIGSFMELGNVKGFCSGDRCVADVGITVSRVCTATRSEVPKAESCASLTILIVVVVTVRYLFLSIPAVHARLVRCVCFHISRNSGVDGFLSQQKRSTRSTNFEPAKN